MVSERSLAVLRAIVQDYVASREPVGSKAIVERHSFGVSAATIRNDMALLEEEELIAAPHTSSGRIPTDKGYRMFVDELAEVRPLTTPQRTAIDRFLGESEDLDELLGRTVRVLSNLTNQLAVVQYPVLSSATVRHVELVPLGGGRLLSVLITDNGNVEQRVIDAGRAVGEETLSDLRSRLNGALGGLTLAAAATRLQSPEEAAPRENRELFELVASHLADQARAQRHEKLLIAGAANLVRTEEDFAGTILGVLEAIEEQVVVLRLFGEMVAEQHGVSSRIGRENAEYGLSETSVLTSDFAAAGRVVSKIGVLGPTRMDYSTNMTAVRAVARYLSRQLGEH